MKFDTTDKNIILVSYPSGGFGNFVYHALSVHGSNTCKVPTNFDFSSNGNSHAASKYCNVYFKDPDTYRNDLSFDGSGRKVILCDNGILNDSYLKIRTVFPNATIVRLIIDNAVRPIIQETLSYKALNTNTISAALGHVHTNWGTCEPYAIREHFTLMYHNWSYKWQPITGNRIVNVSIKNLVDDPVATISTLVQNLDMEVLDKHELINLCDQWATVNARYFEPYYEWGSLESALNSSNVYALSHITNLHTQGYLNYRIECMYNVTIPVYDYREWFSNSTQILEMIKCSK